MLALPKTNTSVKANDMVMIVLVLVVLYVLYKGIDFLKHPINNIFGDADKAAASNDAAMKQMKAAVTPFSGNAWLKANPRASVFIPAANKVAAAEKIYASFNTLHGMVNSVTGFEEVLQVLKKYDHKSQIAALSQYFNERYKMPLLQFLDGKRGSFGDVQIGSGGEEGLAKIINYVNSLPI